MGDGWTTTAAADHVELVTLLERAQSLAHVGGWHLDLASGDLVFTDESFRIYGREPAGSLHLSELLSWAHPGDRPELAHVLAGATGRDAYETEHRVVRPDGSVRWVRLAGDVLRDEVGTPVALAGALHDVTEHRRAEEQRTRLARQLLRAQEEERSQIAVELHDNALQILIAMSMQIGLLSGRVEHDSQAAAIVGTLTELADSAISELRTLLFELHPPALNLGGLLESLDEYARRFSAPEPPQLVLTGALEQEPTQEEATVLFQIGREALANAYKHAAASLVEVSLTDRDGGLEISVRDDGSGFLLGPEIEVPGHLGLASIRERAESVGGHVEVSSAPGDGTTIRAWIPRM